MKIRNEGIQIHDGMCRIGVEAISLIKLFYCFVSHAGQKRLAQTGDMGGEMMPDLADNGDDSVSFFFQEVMHILTG